MLQLDSEKTKPTKTGSDYTTSHSERRKLFAEAFFRQESRDQQPVDMTMNMLTRKEQKEHWRSTASITSSTGDE